MLEADDVPDNADAVEALEDPANGVELTGDIWPTDGEELTAPKKGALAAIDDVGENPLCAAAANDVSPPGERNLGILNAEVDEDGDATLPGIGASLAKSLVVGI